MIWLRKRMWWAAVLVPLAFTVAGCDDGPAENAGEAVDNAADQVGDAAEEAVDEAGDAADKAAD